MNHPHLNCLLPSKSNSKSNSMSYIPPFERRESASSVKKSMNKISDNNYGSISSPSY